MKNRITKAIAIFMAFCVAFSGLPFLAGNLEANALAKKKKLPKKITLQAAASGQTQAVLKWNKIKSPSKGYAVFRDGKPVKYFNTKKTAYTDNNLEAGTSYTYQIKTYTKKKVKMWFNKKTGKWQKKKPAKKYRGKSKKQVVYSYKKKSNAVTIRTAAAPPSSDTGDNGDGASEALSAPTNVKCVVDNNAKKMTVTWNAVSGATGYYVYKDFSGKSQRKYTDKKGIIDIDVTEGVIYTYYVRAINGDTTSAISSKVTGQLTSQGSGNSGGTDTPTTPTNPEPTTQTVTVTDYLGVTRTFTKKSNETSWLCTASTDGRTGFGTSQMVRYDKNIDGTFINNNNDTLRTYHGATFNVTAIDNFKTDDRTMSFYTVEMYNGDPSKLQLVLDSDVQILERNTFEETGKYTYTAKKKYYYYKEGHPIGKTYDDGAFAKDIKESKSGYTLNKKYSMLITVQCQ